MRLIDADILEKKLHELALDEWNQKASTSWSNALLDCEDMVYNAPTVDVTEVVRCKNCRYFNRYGLQDYTECTHFDCDVTEDGYCWWGERREYEID